MKNKVPKNCWEYWDCPKDVKEKCPAYTLDSGKECWLVAGSFSSGASMKCPKITNKFKYCWECAWFKKVNPDFDK